jgi:hypothetical protein
LGNVGIQGRVLQQHSEARGSAASARPARSLERASAMRRASPAAPEALSRSEPRHAPRSPRRRYGGHPAIACDRDGRNQSIPWPSIAPSGSSSGRGGATAGPFSRARLDSATGLVQRSRRSDGRPQSLPYASEAPRDGVSRVSRAESGPERRAPAGPVQTAPRAIRRDPSSRQLEAPSARPSESTTESRQAGPRASDDLRRAQARQRRPMCARHVGAGSGRREARRA